jgi:hypothetical protein
VYRSAYGSDLLPFMVNLPVTISDTLTACSSKQTRVVSFCCLVFSRNA